MLALTIGAGSAWQVQAWRHEAREAQRLESERETRSLLARRADSAAASHEARRQRIDAEVRVITQEVDRVVERPVYRDRCIDDDGLRLIARAIGGADAASEPAHPMPDAGATD